MIDYHVDPLRRIVTTRVTGRVSLADFAYHLQRILRDPKFKPEFNALIVAIDPTAIPSSTSLGFVQPLVRAWSNRRAGARWAFVLPTNEARASAESLLLNLKLTSVVTRCFLSEASALAWLDAASAPARPDAASSTIPPSSVASPAKNPSV
jgi:hypothetical protein